LTKKEDEMTKPIKATENGLKPHYKVRVALPGSLLHLASWNEPRCLKTSPFVEADWIDEPGYGDTLGRIDWSSVLAVTWRWSE
jgi:hypothetical protein